LEAHLNRLPLIDVHARRSLGGVGVDD